MLKRLLSLMSGAENPPQAAEADGLQLAVAALLVEAATMDSSFDEEERATIRTLLTARFALEPDDCEALLEAAEAKAGTSTQLFGFTSRVVKAWDATERADLIEMLWRVAYSDGALDPHEDALLRRVAGLLHVPDRDRSLARRRALQALGLEP